MVIKNTYKRKGETVDCVRRTRSDDGATPIFFYLGTSMISKKGWGMQDFKVDEMDLG